jgi:hypothetical protein
MGTDIKVFANHTIDFSSNNFEVIADSIRIKLNNSIIQNRSEIKMEVRGYYDWQGYDHDPIREKHYKMIDNWIGDDWEYFINNDLENYIELSFFGPFKLNINFTKNRIEFWDPGCRYDSFFGMDKKSRIEWRKYYYQYIKLFNGKFALYLPDQGEVGKFTERIWDYDLNLDIIAKELLDNYGQNNIGINDFPSDENDFVNSPYYFLDLFEDIK